MSDQRPSSSRRIHPSGYVGLEVKGGVVTVLGAMDGRVPLMSADERHWLANELIRVNEALLLHREDDSA